MELIGEAMGIHIPDLYKRLSLIGDIDTIIADSADLIAAHRLDLDTVRDVLAQDIYGGGASVPQKPSTAAHDAVDCETAPAAGANALLDQRRLSLALRSGASILFAVAFFWPTLTFATLVRLFAAYAFVDGILTLSPGGWSPRTRWVWPLLPRRRCRYCRGAVAYVWPG